MKRVLVLTASASFVLGFGAGYFSAIGTLFFRTTALMEEVVSSHKLQVRCFAKKYSWHFHYAGADGKLGDTDNSLITGENPVGLNLLDPRSKDDIISSELILPCETQVELITGSADVIHSLGHFHGEMEIDAVPEVAERDSFKTPGKPVSGTLSCVQLCGPGFKDHHAPYRYVVAATFEEWLSAQQPLSERISAKPGSK